MTEPHATVSPYGADEYEKGLSKREYFAAMVLQGLCSSPDWAPMDYELAARHAVAQADALIEELNR